MQKRKVAKTAKIGKSHGEKVESRNSKTEAEALDIGQAGRHKVKIIPDMYLRLKHASIGTYCRMNVRKKERKKEKKKPKISAKNMN